MEELSKHFEQALLTLNRLEAKRIIMNAAGRLAPLAVVEQVIVGALERIGDGWQKGDVALSQVYMSGRICEELVDELLPSGDPVRRDQPPMAIAALDDYHLLGKRLVYSVLRAGGFALKDYGRVTVEEALRKAREDRLFVFLVSTLMLPSALHVRDLVEGLRTAGLDVKVVVGGAPFLFDSRLWQEVGADAMGRSASEAPRLIETLLEGAR
jgi:methanogenic corrinoid protein MtbC1